MPTSEEGCNADDGSAAKRPCTALGTRRAPTARTFSPLPSPLPPFFFLLSLCSCLQVSVPACGARLSLLPPSARASRRATSSPPSPFLSSPSLLLPLSLTRYVQGALRLPCFVCARFTKTLRNCYTLKNTEKLSHFMSKRRNVVKSSTIMRGKSAHCSRAHHALMSNTPIQVYESV